MKLVKILTQRELTPCKNNPRDCLETHDSGRFGYPQTEKNQIRAGM